MMKKFGISEDELATKLQRETQPLESLNFMKGEEAKFKAM